MKQKNAAQKALGHGSMTKEKGGEHGTKPGEPNQAADKESNT